VRMRLFFFFTPPRECTNIPAALHYTFGDEKAFFPPSPAASPKVSAISVEVFPPDYLFFLL